MQNDISDTKTIIHLVMYDDTQLGFASTKFFNPTMIINRFGLICPLSP